MRQAATIASAFLLLLLQSTIVEVSPVHLVTPALGLLVVLHMGLSPKWTPSSTALVAFCVGYLFDLVSGAPRGVHAFVFVLMSLLARLIATKVAVRGFVLTAATGFVTSLVAAGIIVVVNALVSSEGDYTGFREAPLEALMTGLFAPLVLWLLQKLDGRLDPARLRVGLARRRSRRLAGAPGRR